MAGITEEQAVAKLALWMAADAAVATGQSYSIDGRTLERVDEDTIRENIIFWDRQVKRLSRGGMRVQDHPVMVKRRTRATFKPNAIDRLVSYFSPVQGARRLKARAFMALAGGYAGASKSSRALKMWAPYGFDADSDTLPDLSTLRERSRDLIRNNPLACGAIATKVINVVGTGLKLHARIDRKVLNLTDEQAEAWEAAAERQWRLFWNTKDVDAARTLTGDAVTRQVYRQARENGDVFVVLPRIRRAGDPYSLKIQIVEADRVCNKDNAADTDTLTAGIQKDAHGAPVAYHVLKHHPGNNRHIANAQWQVVPAFGKETGLRNVIHLFDPARPGQTRGVPDLAPVIEALKQVGRYTEAELSAAVVSGMFTVFIESESGDPTLDLTDMSSETGAEASDDDYKMAPGAIIGLAKGEKVHDSNPGRPNTSFDPFVSAIMRQIGVALQLPYEVLIKHFTASYSAARAALLEAWRFFITERHWLAANFNQLVYEVFMFEAVAGDRIHAPGYFSDPVIRAAYLGTEWIGPARGQIDELKEVKAAELRVNMGISTLAETTAEMTGGDWERKHEQSVKEHNARKAAGLLTDNGMDIQDLERDTDE